MPTRTGRTATAQPPERDQYADVQYFRTRPNADRPSGNRRNHGFAGAPTGAPAGTLRTLISGDQTRAPARFCLAQISGPANKERHPFDTAYRRSAYRALPSKLIGWIWQRTCQPSWSRTHNITVGLAISIPLAIPTAKGLICAAPSSRRQQLDQPLVLRRSEQLRWMLRNAAPGCGNRATAIFRPSKAGSRKRERQLGR